MGDVMTKSYSDNTRVLVRHEGRVVCEDFFAVRLQAATPHSPWTVALNRYTLPGRTDVYWFDWMSGSIGFDGSYRLRFFTDARLLSLPAALALLMGDLNQKNVIELLVNALSGKNRVTGDSVPRHTYRPLVEDLLPMLAPGSRALRACRAAWKKGERK